MKSTSGKLPSREPTLDFIDTPDGWRLAAYRYRPLRGRGRRYPVLLIHGMSTNRFDVDFSNPRLSLAKYLNRQGFDTWVVELRGTGKSYRRGLVPGLKAKLWSDWTFDDHIFKDLPVVVDYLKKVTKRRKFHWVGHSLGGTVVYAAIGALGSSVCASAAVLGAAMSASAKPGIVKLGLKADPLVKRLPILPFVLLAKLGRSASRWLLPLEDNNYYSAENMDPETIQEALRVAVENVSVPLFMQMHGWYKNNHFCSVDKKVSYRDNLKKIKSPFLVGAGSVDGVTPYPDVHFGYRRLGSKDKKLVVFGKEQGFMTDYGHVDLVLGRHAPREVYPVIADWLEGHDV